MAMHVSASRMANIVQRFHVLQNKQALCILRRNYFTLQKEAKAWNQLLRKSGYEDQSKVLKLLPSLFGYQKLDVIAPKRHISTSKVFLFSFCSF